MIDVAKYVQNALNGANYDVILAVSNNPISIGFEDDTKFGFVIIYDTTQKLIANWKTDGDKVIDKFKFQIRNSGEKSWNMYMVYLSLSQASEKERVKLSKIEEDLMGTRKIAQSVIPDEDGIRAGLISLLTIQNPPSLEPVDIKEEIKIRATDLPKKALEAFFQDAPQEEIVRLMGHSHET